jgi:hypothetical protein
LLSHIESHADTSTSLLADRPTLGRRSWFAAAIAYNVRVNPARQFSLAHLCLQILLAGLGFGLSRVLLRPLQSEDDLILVVLACACHGAWIGGFWKQMRLGAMIGGAIGMPLAVLAATG